MLAAKIIFFLNFSLNPGTVKCSPLSKKVKKFLVVEMNEGQMIEDVARFAEADAEIDFFGKSGGVIMYAEEIEKKIKEIL